MGANQDGSKGRRIIEVLNQLKSPDVRLEVIANLDPDEINAYLVSLGRLDLPYLTRRELNLLVGSSTTADAETRLSIEDKLDTMGLTGFKREKERILEYFNREGFALITDLPNVKADESLFRKLRNEKIFTTHGMPSYYRDRPNRVLLPTSGGELKKAEEYLKVIDDATRAKEVQYHEGNPVPPFITVPESILAIMDKYGINIHSARPKALAGLAKGAVPEDYRSLDLGNPWADFPFIEFPRRMWNKTDYKDLEIDFGGTIYVLREGLMGGQFSRQRFEIYKKMKALKQIP